MRDGFWQDVNDLPHEDAAQTKGGMKLSFSRQELENYFGVLLEERPLEQLVGETSIWVLIPTTISIYVFPIILLVTGSLTYSMLSSVGLMMSFSMLNQSSYNYKLNRYVVRPASHAIPKIIFAIGAGVALGQLGYSIWIALWPIFWYLLIDRIPIIYLLSELLMVKLKTWMYALPDPDGVLRQVGWYWAKKLSLRQNDTGKIIGRSQDEKESD